MCSLRDFWIISHAQLSNNPLHLGIVRITRAELKGVRLLEEQKVFDAHGSFPGVIKPRRQLGARIVRIRACHACRQRRCGLWSENSRVIIFICFLGGWRTRRFLCLCFRVCGLLLSLRWSYGLPRLCVRAIPRRAENRAGG